MLSRPLSPEPPSADASASPPTRTSGHADHGGSVAPCEASISRIVEMAWEDRTAFETIEAQFGLNESAVIALMRRHMKPSSFRMWRKRMAGRRTKHALLRGAVVLRHRASHTRQ